MAFWTKFFGTEESADPPRKVDNEPSTATGETIAPTKSVIDPDERIGYLNSIEGLKNIRLRIENTVQAMRGDHTLVSEDKNRRLTIDQEISDAIENVRAQAEARIRGLNSEFLGNEKVFVPGQDNRILYDTILPDKQTWETRLVMPRKRTVTEQAGTLRDYNAGGPVGAVYGEQQSTGPFVHRHIQKGTSKEPEIIQSQDVIYVTFGDNEEKLWEKEITTNVVDEKGNLRQEVVIVDYALEGQEGQEQIVEKSRITLQAKNNEGLVKVGVQLAESADDKQKREQVELDQARQRLKSSWSN